jgi:hypothetical protein
MSVYSVKDVLHRVKIRLHRSNLPRAKGAYYAHVVNEAALSIEDVAAALKNRGGYTGNYYDLVEHVRQFFNEMAYQLCDGFAVNTGWFSIQPVIGGLFESADEGFDPKEHKVGFRYRTGALLRAPAQAVVVELEGRMDTGGGITCFTDAASAMVNKRVTPDGFFTISGNKIKVKGDSPDCGVWFVSTTSPFRRYKVERALTENVSTKVIGMVPPLPAGKYVVEIKTCYTVGGIDLKQPKTIKSGFTLKASN